MEIEHSASRTAISHAQLSSIQNVSHSVGSLCSPIGSRRLVRRIADSGLNQFPILGDLGSLLFALLEKHLFYP